MLPKKGILWSQNRFDILMLLTFYEFTTDSSACVLHTKTVKGYCIFFEDERYFDVQITLKQVINILVYLMILEAIYCEHVSYYYVLIDNDPDWIEPSTHSGESQVMSLH